VAGNSFGKVFTVTTFGESHGKAIGAVIDGVPPHLALDEGHIQKELDRRRPGQSGISTPRAERDRVEILSGLFKGVTTGTPLALLIRNEDMDSSAYEKIQHLYRPGHADYTYTAKYGIRDWRGSGRASGRETAARVAAGAVAKKILLKEEIRLTGYALEIGGVRAVKKDFSRIEENIVRTPDVEKVSQMVRRIEEARKRGDSVGGIVEVVVDGCGPGLGEPVFDKLDALLAHAVMSIGAVKAVEIGSGIDAARMSGSCFNDPFFIEGGKVRTKSNNAGGILGGISTGESIVLRAAIRPPASIAVPQTTVSTNGGEETIEVHGRHDPCIVPRVIPVIEAMMAITLADCVLQQKMYD
jgi:chorismate synthase